MYAPLATGFPLASSLKEIIFGTQLSLDDGGDAVGFTVGNKVQVGGTAIGGAFVGGATVGDLVGAIVVGLAVLLVNPL
jgi:hypothetical protein